MPRSGAEPTEVTSLLQSAAQRPQEDVVDGWLSTIQLTLLACDVASMVGAATLTGAALGVEALRDNVYATLAPWWAACFLALLCQLRVAMGACAVRVGGTRSFDQMNGNARPRRWGYPVRVDMSTLPLLMQLALHLLCSVPVVLLLGSSLLLMALHVDQQRACVTTAASTQTAVDLDNAAMQVPTPEVQLAQAAAPIFALLSWAFIHCIFFRTQGFVCGLSALLLLVACVLTVLKVDSLESGERFDAALKGIGRGGVLSEEENGSQPLASLSWFWVTAPYLLLFAVLFFSLIWTSIQQCTGLIRLSKLQHTAAALYTISIGLVIAAYLGVEVSFMDFSIFAAFVSFVLGLQGVVIVALSELGRLRASRGFANPLPLAQTPEGHWVASTGGYENWFMLGYVEVVRPKQEPFTAAADPSWHATSWAAAPRYPRPADEEVEMGRVGHANGRAAGIKEGVETGPGKPRVKGGAASVAPARKQAQPNGADRGSKGAKKKSKAPRRASEQKGYVNLFAQK